MNNIMIDIETLGNEERSVILSVGAVLFTLGEDRRVGDHFYVNIDVADSLDHRFKVDSRTFYWWLRQSDDARKSLSDPKPVKLLDALDMFADFVDFERNTDRILWAFPPQFDLKIIDSAYKHLQLRRPWSYRAEECARSYMRNAARLGWQKPALKKKGKHNALEDALRQTYQVHSAEAYLIEMRKKAEGK